MNKLITFTPLDEYFFGGENTFGSGSKERQNYYAESRLFPQQSSFVGLFRHVMYEAGEKVNMGSSFVINQTNNFGWLQGLSPVFLVFDGADGLNFYIPIVLPVDENGNAMRLELELSNSESIPIKGGWTPAYIVQGYKEKYGMTTFYLNPNDGTLLKEDDIFITQTNTGIARHRTDHTALDGMFYRQKLYRLKKGFSFATIVGADPELFKLLDNRNMPMGGEKKSFALKVHQYDKNFEDTFETDALKQSLPSEMNWIWLSSDAFVHQSVYDYSAFAVAQTQGFRNIVTPGQTYNVELSQKGKDGNVRYKSKYFTLLKRGTLLVPPLGEDEQDIVSSLESEQFIDIGYNTFFQK